MCESHIRPAHGELAGGATIDELRRALRLTHSGTVRLVAGGLVERRVGGDARSVSLHLSATGRRTARRVLVARETALERALIALKARQRVQLDELLEALLSELEGPRRRVCRLCDTAACGRCPRVVVPSTRGLE